ncbi:MAG TPA: hypothetical protein VKU02_14955 [Gemmataceae bacterium]|nr:hypothetical protein [Gemmataceae bacterium]
MRLHPTLGGNGDAAGWTLLVVGLSLAIAVSSARPYAGGWNDGSRLATVECLVDFHTLAIDRSIFVQVPPPEESQPPYPLDEPELLRTGTLDKLWIHGQFYSDKSPVPAFLLAGAYEAWQWCTNATARQRPGSFCYWMTLASSGIAYVIAVTCMYHLGRALRLRLPLRLAVTASFALATVALPYVRHVNNHILLLAVAAALFLCLARLAEEMKTGTASIATLLILGGLVGLGYTIDLGAGPVLLLCTAAVLAYRCPRPVSFCWFALAALPWLVLHHGVNYMVGGSFTPANAVAEYFDWPGCPFNAQNMTGSWKHASVLHFLVYAADLLVGKRGFLGHNLPLCVALPALLVLLRRRRQEWPELLLTGSWCAGTWLLYAATSNNSSGQCCSIRWFVPLLAPGYYVMAVFLREYPGLGWVFGILSSWGGVLAALMWWQGTWMKHMIPFYWPLQVAAFLTLAIYWNQRRRSQDRQSRGSIQRPAPSQAA